jgi:hypothetical protein
MGPARVHVVAPVTATFGPTLGSIMVGAGTGGKLYARFKTPPPSGPFWGQLLAKLEEKLMLPITVFGSGFTAAPVTDAHFVASNQTLTVSTLFPPLTMRG